jgi:ABC-type lipoprotein release transport system permease subunit
MMRSRFDTLAVLAQIAVRNLLASGWKSSIVAGIIGFGAFLVVVGTSLVDGIDGAMRGSITGSLAGHIQVYSSHSHDELDIMGAMSADPPDLAPLEDFAKVNALLASVPNVKSVVPMGISNALVLGGNSVDGALEALRTVVTARAAGDHSAELESRYAAAKSLVKQVLSVLGTDFDNARKLESEQAVSAEDMALMKRVGAAGYWALFDADPFRELELLENRVAPLAADGDNHFLRYAGTDPDAFAQSFERMEIVDGQAIPRGQRGFLISKYVYEDELKLRAAHGLDLLKLAHDARGARIAEDPDLQRIVQENTTAVREILLQLDPPGTARVISALQTFLHTQQNDAGTLLSQFFETTDENLEERYRFFYDRLAPELQLYRLRVGDQLAITAITRGGYIKSVKVKIWGTFSFAGLEQSPQAGGINLMDLITFRELYGFMTPEHEREIQSLRAAAGVSDLTREDAEAELFGTRLVATRETPTAVDAPAHKVALPSTGANDDHFDPEQLKAGAILNAAVLVKDERQLDRTIQAIELAAKRAGLPLKAVSWQKAAGVLGQFARFMSALLYIAVLIIFVVGLVIINNSLVMATLERVGEIGMLRAIGAQRQFVLAIMLLESMLVGLLAGAIGAALGVAVVLTLSKTGIPATNAVVTFFFSGPRLYPKLSSGQLGGGLSLVLFVSVASGVYPALLAMRISPREAMQPEE